MNKQVTHRECDNCGENHPEESLPVNWLTVRIPQEVINAVEFPTEARPAIVFTRQDYQGEKLTIRAGDQIDFCNVKCMREWIEKGFAKKD